MQFTEHQTVLFSQILMFHITLLHAAPATASETLPYPALSKTMHCKGLYLYLSSKVLNSKNPG